MGALGLCLVFVGIVLVVNGVCRLTAVDARSQAVMNIITTMVLLCVNFVTVCRATATVDYLNAVSGFLFGFTYFFISANLLFKLDWRPFGWYSLFVAVFATMMATLTADIRMVVIWLAWAALWLEGFLEFSVGIKKLGKIYPWLSIAEGIFTAFLPALLMLTERW